MASTNTNKPADRLTLRGRILANPNESPLPGVVRVERGRIAEVNLGSPSIDDERADAGGPDHLICPAFIDAHVHLPQIDAVGCDGLELLPWLESVVFPAEVWWGDGGAPHMTRTFAHRAMRAGTVGFAGYLTSHGAINAEALRWLALHTPMRFVAGRVAMDRNAPDALTREDRERAHQQPRPSPMLPPFPPEDARHAVSANPRFAVSCTEELLAEVGWAARESTGAEGTDTLPFIQTHLAENRDECARVRELFPSAPHYTSVYDNAGLLTPRTLLAHCIHLSDEEWALIAERGSVVVHCPTANTFLGSGLFDLDAAERHGVRLALGSDVAGGPDIAMPRVARAMIEVAKMRRMTGSGSGDAQSVRVPTPAQAWHLITQGNADALGWTDAGRIEPGASADLLVLRPPVTWYDEHLIGRLLYNWDDRLIERRVYNGSLQPEPSPAP